MKNMKRLRKKEALSDQTRVLDFPCAPASCPGMTPRTPQWLFWTIGCFYVALAASLLADKQPEAAETLSLEKIVDGLQNDADSVQEKAKELLDVVDSEASAKRISQPSAQGLRWSFRNLTASGNVDVRTPLAAATLPVEDEAIMKAAQALQEVSTAARAKSAEWMRQAERAAESRCSELVGNATSAGAVDAFLSTLERLRILGNGQQGYNPRGNVDRCMNTARSLRDSFDLTPASDPETVRSILQALTPMRMGSDFGRHADFAKRTAEVLAPYKKAFEDAQKDLDAALTDRKPSKEVYATLAVFEDAVNRYTSIANFGPPAATDYLALLNNYRTLCAIARSMESRHWQHAQREVVNARQSTSQSQTMAGRRDALNKYLDKWEHEIGEAEAADAREFQERLHVEFGAVKKPADLAAIISELAKRQRDLEEGNGPRYSQGPSPQLSAFAAAWAADDLNRLANGAFRGGNQEDAVPGEDLAALRERIERDILSRTLKAPELPPPGRCRAG